MPVSAEIIRRLRSAVGPNGYLDRENDMQAYVQDWRGRFHGATPIVLRPDCTAQVAAIVEICAGSSTGIVPQGGNTGMVAGAIPREHGEEVIVSLSRMNRVRDLDTDNYTMTLEAGCVLADVQSAAHEAGRLFPLSLAAEGSCQIGGNLSTNAGGTAVLRYGNARDMVLGLEVVLASGEVWHGLRRLRKDNTGLDLKQLFLGAEGTLGIITAAVIKLFPLPADTQCAMVAVSRPAEATRLLARLREVSADAVVTFEYIDRRSIELVLEHIPGTVDPLPEPFEHYLLVELAGGQTASALSEILESVLAEGFERGRVLNATIASSEAQVQQLWRLRETIPEAARAAGGVIAHDISVPVSSVAEFLQRGVDLAERTIPGVRVLAFGHLGDGNIHFNLAAPERESPEQFFTRREQITPRIDDLVGELHGSFSAEHGIGQLKKAQLARYRAGVELELMRTVKHALDPAGIMNPGKVFD